MLDYFQAAMISMRRVPLATHYIFIQVDTYYKMISGVIASITIYASTPQAIMRHAAFQPRRAARPPAGHFLASRLKRSCRAGFVGKYHEHYHLVSRHNKPTFHIAHGKMPEQRAIGKLSNLPYVELLTHDSLG